jgi:hypothetical protein
VNEHRSFQNSSAAVGLFYIDKVRQRLPASGERATKPNTRFSALIACSIQFAATPVNSFL